MEQRSLSQEAFMAYVDQLHIAQASHCAWEWIKAGARFRQMLAASGVEIATYDNPYGEKPPAMEDAP